MEEDKEDESTVAQGLAQTMGHMNALFFFLTDSLAERDVSTVVRQLVYTHGWPNLVEPTQGCSTIQYEGYQHLYESTAI